MQAAIVVVMLAAAVLWAESVPAAEVAVRAPTSCDLNIFSCEDDISAADAESRAQAFAAQVLTCGTNPNVSTSECSDLPPLLDGHLCDANSVSYDWAYPEDLRGGYEELQLLLQRAKSGEVFDEHKMIVEANGSTQDEQHLALCYVQIVEGAAGPPRECTTVAILTGSQTILRVGTSSDTIVCLASATLSIGGSISVNFEITTALAGAAFVDALYAMLKQQLGFASVDRAEIGSDGAPALWRLVAASPLRESPILGNNWRESMDLDLHVVRNSDGYSVSASTKPLVSRYNAGSMVEYHYPDDAQRGVYMQTLNSWIGDALHGVCSSVTVFDDTNFQCN